MLFCAMALFSMSEGTDAIKILLCGMYQSAEHCWCKGMVNASSWHMLISCRTPMN